MVNPQETMAALFVFRLVYMVMCVLSQVNGVTTQTEPTFTSCSSYSPSIAEHAAIGTSVQTVSATDSDRGPDGLVTYTITTEPAGIFTINSTSGDIVVGVDIDREQYPFSQVTVKGKDGGIPSLEGWCTFNVTINDINDHAPEFDRAKYVANITVEHPITSNFVAIRASDADVGNNGIITYSLLSDGDGQFGILLEDGFIFLTELFTQADQNGTFVLTAMTKDGGNPALNSTCVVEVNVKPGSHPTWDRDYSSQTFRIDEGVTYGTPVIQDMSCQSNNADTRVEFQLDSSNTEFFYIGSPPGNGNMVTLYAKANLDYLSQVLHEVRIRCVNYGSVTLTTVVNPQVQLIDVNNQRPEFQRLSDGRYSVEVPENKPSGTLVAIIVARDADFTNPFNVLTFSVTEGSENFTIETGQQPNTAIIRTKRLFDRETFNSHFVKVKAEDGAPSTLSNFNPGPNTATVIVHVRITNVNDNPPFFDQSYNIIEPTLPAVSVSDPDESTVMEHVKITNVNNNPPFFEQQLYNIVVNESYHISEPILPAVSVSDADESDRGRHAYRITSGNGNPEAFGVFNEQGNLFLLRNLDFENGDKSFSLQLEASNGILTATTSVDVTVLDVNDNIPVFSESQYSFNDITENDNNVPRQILTVRATDADVYRPNQIRYHLEGNAAVIDHFIIDPISGAISVTRSLDRDQHNGFAIYQFTVAATDELTNPNTGYASVSVGPRDENDNTPRCAPGYHPSDNPGTCTSDCVPNPCFQNAACQLDNGTVVCDCAPFSPWQGQFCNIYPTEGDNDPDDGLSGSVIAAVVLACVLAIVLVLVLGFVFTFHRRGTQRLNKAAGPNAEEAARRDDMDSVTTAYADHYDVPNMAEVGQPSAFSNLGQDRSSRERYPGPREEESVRRDNLDYADDGYLHLYNGLNMSDVGQRSDYSQLGQGAPTPEENADLDYVEPVPRDNEKQVA
ncbi:neural-cadherin-like [Littorina saxatilis]|uniref:neural-cadherin-like n=1 Tax=Littorina saxatilis TaxID=31220 RepID=UPI0038B65660